MRNGLFRQTAKKCVASLLISVMLFCDTSVSVFADPIEGLEEAAVVVDNHEGESAREASDEVDQLTVNEGDNLNGDIPSGNVDLPSETETQSVEVEKKDGSEEQSVEQSSEQPTSEGESVSENTDPAQGGKITEAEETEYVEIPGEEYTMETSNGAPGQMRVNRFLAFSNNSRGDYYHRYYNQLSEEEKRLYDFLLEHAEDFITHSYDNEGLSFVVYDGEDREAASTSEVSNPIFDDLKNAFGAFSLDHPEVFWIDINKINYKTSFLGFQRGSQIVYSRVTLTFSSRKANSQEYEMLLDRYCKGNLSAASSAINADKERINSAINSITQSSDFRNCSTVIQKAGIINDILTYNNYYNRYVAKLNDDSNSFAHISVSALISNSSQLAWLTSASDLGDQNAPVCEGYAKAFKAVCDRSDIPCVVGIGDDHAWNYVQTEDGVWYAVDTTWDDPVRSDEWTNRTTPPDAIRRYFMVGSETICDGDETFVEEGHHPNSAHIVGARVLSVPTISPTRAEGSLLGPVISLVDNYSPSSDDGVITAKFNTDKPGTYYWVLHEAGSDAPGIYDIQNEIATITNGSGHGDVTSDMIGSGDPVSFSTPWIPGGNYDLYIIQLTPEEYVSNIIKYSNVVNENLDIRIHSFKANSASIPSDNTICVGSAYTVEYDIVPEDFPHQLDITIDSSNRSVISVDDNSRLRPYKPGQADITITAEYEIDGTARSVTSDPLTVTVRYPEKEIFEDGGLRYSNDGLNLYEGWLTKVGNTYKTAKIDGDYPVYYFKPASEGARPSAVKGEQTIDELTYLFGPDCVLVREWIKIQSIDLAPVPASANQSGEIDENTLSVGASYTLTATVNPNIANDSYDPEWKSWISVDPSEDPSSFIRITPAGTKDNEIYARIDVLRKTDDPATSIKIAVEAGEDSNRVRSNTVEIYTRYPVGWHKIGEKTYYGIVEDASPRNTVEHALGRKRIGNKEYYFEPDGENAGAMVTGVISIDGILYDYGDDGALRGRIEKEGFVKLSDGVYYYDRNGVRVVNSIVSDDRGNHYYMNPDGRLVADGWIIYTPSGSSSVYHLYAGDDGVLADGISIISGRQYLFISQREGEMVYPCTLAKGMTVVGDKTYYANDSVDPSECKLLSGYFWVGEGNARRYYYALSPNDVDPFALQSGWVLVGDVWRHFEETGPARFEETASSSDSGWIQRNDTGKRYYRKANGKFLSGWQTIDGNKYYFDADGSIATGLWMIGGKYYYFGESNSWDYEKCMPNNNDNFGIMQTGRVTYSLEGQNHTNYFNASGIRQNGWQKYVVTDEGVTKELWDFFGVNDPETPDSYGATLVSGEDCWYEIVRGADKSRYCFLDNKTQAKGWQTVNGSKYYFDTAMDAFGSTGRMGVGVITVGTNKYYLREDATEGLGTLVTGLTSAKDGMGISREYFADANGVLKLGWQKVNGEWSFFDYQNGYRIADSTVGKDGWVVIPETVGDSTYYYKYYFKNGTTPVTGLQTINGRMYCFGDIKNDKNYGRLLTGLFKSGKNYYYGTPYTDEAGANSVNAGQIRCGLFTVNASGEDETRFANDKGIIQTGWVSVDGRNRYFLTEKDINDFGCDPGLVGKQIKVERVEDSFVNCEWYKGLEEPLAGKYFCFRGGTTLLKGWQSVNGYKYYFDPTTGRQWTGVNLIANSWYDLGCPSVNGYPANWMKTGWSAGSATVSDYYYNQNGIRVSGWVKIDGKNYYFAKTAASDPGYGFKQRAGLLTDGRNTYVLDDDGAMLIGYVAYGGKRYFTNTSGVLQYGWQMIDGRARYFATASEENPGAEIDSSYVDNSFIKVGESRYYLKNGNKPATGFVTISGKRYYFDNSGVLQTGWFEVGGKHYYGYTEEAVAQQSDLELSVGELAKGYCVELSGEGDYSYYFDEKNNTVSAGLVLVDGVYRFFNPSADLPGGFGAERSLSEYGKPAGFYKLDDSDSIIYIVKGKIQTGWKTIEGLKYYFDNSGILKTGEFTIGRDTYRTYTLDEATVKGNPALVGSICPGFVNDNDKATHYYDVNGKRLTGWLKIENDNYYFDPATGSLKVGRFTVGKNTYFSDANGRRLDGLVRHNGNLFFCDKNGIAQSGMRQIDSKLWYFASEYEAYTYDVIALASCPISPFTDVAASIERPDWYKVSFASTDPGQINRDYVIINSTGGKTIKKGWQTIPGLDGNKHKYYFDQNNGAMFTGFKTISGKEYSFGEDPSDLATFGTFDSSSMCGFTNIGGTDRYRYVDKNGISVTGFIKTESGTFYLYPDGTLAAGLTTIGKNSYYFNETAGSSLGKMAVNEEVTVNSKTYIFGEDGTMKTGWQKYGDYKRYYGPELIKGTQTILDNGKKVYIASIANALYRLQSDGSTFIQVADPGTTKGYDAETGLYTDANSKIITGWQTITVNNVSHRMYFMPSTGFCAVSADNPVMIGSNRYLFDESGFVLTGYREVGGDHYCLASDGKILTGWQNVKDDSGVTTPRYFAADTGKEVTSTYIETGRNEGWRIWTTEGKPVRYYFRNGRALTGWQKVPGAYEPHSVMRFYFNPDGTLAYTDKQTGELSVANVIYRTVRYTGVDETDFGQITGGFYKTHGQYRYANEDGKAITGWVTVNGKKYYLNPNGIMCTGVTEINGVKYYFRDCANESERNPETNPAYGSLQYGDSHGVINSQRPDAEYLANVKTGALSTGWALFDNDGIREVRYYSTDSDSYGQRQDVTIGAVSLTGSGWYEMGGNSYYIEKTSRSLVVKKGFIDQTVNTGGADRTVRFCLDSSTGALARKEGVFSVGSSRYFGIKDTTLPDGVPKFVVATGDFTVGDDFYCADSKGIVKTGMISVKRDGNTYMHFYSPEDGKLFRGGFFTYNNNVYYAYDNGDLAKGRVTLTIDGEDHDYYFDDKNIRKSGWISFKEADNKSYKYYYDQNGRLIRGGRYVIDGKEYFFGDDGKLQTGVFAVNSDSYCADRNGVLIKGWSLVVDPVTKKKVWRYYRLTDGREITSQGSVDTMIYAPGSNASNYWGIVKEDGRISAYYFTQNRTLCRNGWFTVDGKRYYFDADGRLDASGTENVKLVGNIDGSALDPEIPVSVKTVGSDRFVIKPVDDAVLNTYNGAGDFGGYAISGFVKDGAGNLLFANDKGSYVRGSFTVKHGNVTQKHYADERSRVLTGPCYVGDKLYLYDDAEHFGRLLSIDHAASDGMIHYNGAKYLTDKNGLILTGWQMVKAETGVTTPGFFDTVSGKEIEVDGNWSGNWVTLRNGKTYYFPDGKQKVSFAKGFKTIGDKKYYFDSSTGVLKKASAGSDYISFSVGPDTYESDVNGVLTTGWGRHDSHHYFDDNGRMVKGFHTVSGAGAGVYCFDEYGRMETGISLVNQKRYVFGIDGTATKGKLLKNYYGDYYGDGNKYASDENGVLRTGWQFFATEGESEWHYFDPVTWKESEYPAPSFPDSSDAGYTWRVINDSQGRGKFCFKNNKLLTGWQTINSRKYYFGSYGRMAVGSVRIGQTLYYFNDTISDSDPAIEGSLVTDGVINEGGRRYYMTPAGQFRTGWFTEGTNRYYGDPVSGELAVGFKKLDGSIYYFSETEATIGQMQTGFFKLPDLHQKYFDTTPGASNMYYAGTDGVVSDPGLKTIVHDPKVSTSQQWTYLFAPNRPCVDMGDFVLTGEVVIGDVLIDENDNVRAFLDDGQGNSDGFQNGVDCTLFDENGVSSAGTVSNDDIGQYYRFDPVTGARRKEVLYFYGNYYGSSIDKNQRDTITSMRKYINTDKANSTESDDFIIVNGEDAQPLIDKGLTGYPGSTFPMCASSKVPSESKAYKPANDIAKYSSADKKAVLGLDEHVDVCDVELYSKDVYAKSIAKYGPRNLVLMGASSGAAICLGLYAYAIEEASDRDDWNLLPAEVILLCPWLDAGMSDSRCNSITPGQSGSTDVQTLKYWGARYTRDPVEEEYALIPGPGTDYAFANSLKIDEETMKHMNNIYMYTGSYDPCHFDCDSFADMVSRKGAQNVHVETEKEARHGFMFFTKGSPVPFDACRKVMTQ